jgi:hypothetical protein
MTVEHEYLPPDGALAVVVLDGWLTWDGRPLSVGDTVLSPFAGAALSGHGVIALASRDA